MARINIDKLYFAEVQQDDATGLTFAAPEYIPGVRQVDVKVKFTTEKLHAEGRVWDQETTMEDVEIDIDLAELSNEKYAKYLGHHVANEGGVFALEGDAAPYIAILLEATKSGGKKTYRVYYKGKLEEPNENTKGKEGKIDYQTHKVTARFQSLNNNGMWKYNIDEDDPNAPLTLKETFFTSVIVPTKLATV